MIYPDDCHKCGFEKGICYIVKDNETYKKLVCPSCEEISPHVLKYPTEISLTNYKQNFVTRAIDWLSKLYYNATGQKETKRDY